MRQHREFWLFHQICVTADCRYVRDKRSRRSKRHHTRPAEGGSRDKGKVCSTAARPMQSGRGGNNTYEKALTAPAGCDIVLLPSLRLDDRGGKEIDSACRLTEARPHLVAGREPLASHAEDGSDKSLNKYQNRPSEQTIE